MPGLFSEMATSDVALGVAMEDLVVLRRPTRAWRKQRGKRVWGWEFPTNVRDQISFYLGNK